MDENNTERKSINLTKESGRSHVREAYPIYNNNTDQNSLERQEYRNRQDYQQPQQMMSQYEDPMPARNNYGVQPAQQNYPAQTQYQQAPADDLNRYYNYEAPVQNVPQPVPQITQPPVPQMNQMNAGPQMMNNQMNQQVNNQPMKFCKFCGERIPADAVICTHCGRQVEEIRGAGVNMNRSMDQPVVNVNNNFGSFDFNESDKSKSTSVLLAALGFFGLAGIHRFYVGKPLSGLLWLCTGGLCGIGTLVDVIQIASGTFKDGAGRIIKK